MTAVNDAVLLDVAGQVATITLNRPAKRNSMSAELLDRFEAVIAEVGRREDVRVAIVTGNGKCFCAGADFGAIQELAERLGANTAAERPRAIRALYDAFLCVESLEVPVIAAINGHCVGGGLGLALACDLRIVAASAKIGANFARLGIHPGMLISSRLPQLVGEQQARRLLFTGELIRGDEAARIGLCLESVATEDVLDRARDLALRIAAAAPLAVKEIKRTLQQVHTMTRESVLEHEALTQTALSQTNDAAEGISAVLARREPTFKGS